MKTHVLELNCSFLSMANWCDGERLIREEEDPTIILFL